MIKCNLGVLMAERKLSIQDVSDKTGLSRTTISALVNETGKGIQFDTMDALCELLKITPGALFSFSFIKCECSFDMTGESDEEALYGDDDGNAIESEKHYTVIAKINIQNETFSFKEQIEGMVTLSINHSTRDITYHLNLETVNLKAYLQKLTYAEVQYVKDCIFETLSDFTHGLGEYKWAKLNHYSDFDF